MEDIQIPKLSVLMKYDKIFTDFKKFCEITGYNPQSTLTRNIQTEKKHKQSVFSVSGVFRSLRNSILNTTRKDYNIIIDEELTSDTLLSRDSLNVLREKKNMLLSIINKHEVAMGNLREARIKCWKTQAKLDKYSLIVATQKSALLYNEDEKAVRERAMKKMESVLHKWTIEHKKDRVHFEKMFLQEISLREKLIRISRNIETEICANIHENIVQLMVSNKQTVGAKELNKLTKMLYDKVCRVYSFQIIENSPCNKQWIEKPIHRCCEMKKKDFIKMTKSSNLRETTGEHLVGILA